MKDLKDILIKAQANYIEYLTNVYEPMSNEDPEGKKDATPYEAAIQRAEVDLNRGGA